MTFWLNGAFDDNPVAIRIDDRGFTLGDGLFETLAARDGAPAHLAAHLARLREAAAALFLPVPAGDREIADAMAGVLIRCGLDKGAASLRLTLSRGVAGRGLALPENPRPGLLITAAALPPPPAFLSTLTASARRMEGSLTSRYKTLGYLDNIMAREEARRAGTDEALIRNSRGRLVAASAANLFIVVDAVLITPPVKEGALPGITRSRVLAAARKLGLDVVCAPLDKDLPTAATEVFLTSSLIGICPVASHDGRAFPAPGPVTSMLREALSV